MVFYLVLEHAQELNSETKTILDIINKILEVKKRIKMRKGDKFTKFDEGDSREENADEFDEDLDGLDLDD